MLIHRDALAVAEATNGVDSRYFLSGALFDKKGRAVATDGHVLVRFTSETVDAEEFKIDGLDISPAADVIVSTDDLKAAKATMSSRRDAVAGALMAIVPNGDSVTLATKTAGHEVVIKARKVDGTFPAYERILEVKDPVADIVLSIDVLDTVVRTARGLGVKSLTFRLHGDPAKGALQSQVTFKGEAAHGKMDGAMMPMRA